MKGEDYSALIAREAVHRGTCARAGGEPQIWDDDRLFEMFFGRGLRRS
jgi:hypothetical protein